MRAPIDQAAALRAVRRMQSHPGEWCRDVLGVSLWERQAAGLQALADGQRWVLMISAHGVGKSYTAAVAALWAGSMWPSAQIITTAPTERQVRGILWREIPALWRRAKIPLGGALNKTSLEWAPDWRIWGFTASQHSEANAQGFHAPRLGFIIDEACGVAPSIWAQVKSTVTGEGGFVLAIANPTDPESEMARIWSSSREAARIRISAFDSPNFTATGIVEEDIFSGAWKVKQAAYIRQFGGLPAPHLVTPEWVAGVWEDVGHNPLDPYWIARVRAGWPVSGESGVVPFAWCEASSLRPVHHDRRPPPWVLGVDVASGSGGDESVIVARRGPEVRVVRATNTEDVMELCGHVVEAVRTFEPVRVYVDSVGLGGGVEARLRELGVPVRGVNVGERSTDPARFANLKAELWWTLREAIQGATTSVAGAVRAEPITLPPTERRLWSQCSSVRYSRDSAGRYVIESKDALKRRGVRSPDHAEALMLTFAPWGSGGPGMRLPQTAASGQWAPR